MKQQWLAMEHYRMHSIEEWPDGPLKTTALAAVRSAMASLSWDPTDRPTLDCQICLGRKRARSFLQMALERAA